MKFPLSSLCRLALAALAIALAQPTLADAADSNPDDSPLVIANGKIQRNGQPATLGNVLAVVQARFPAVNITVMAPTDVPVGDLTLAWRRRPPPPGNLFWIEPPVLGVLTAINIATGEKVHVEHASESDFLILPPRHDGGQPVLEIFNISQFFARGPSKASLEAELQVQELRRAALQKPRAVGDDARQQELASVENGIEVTRALLAAKHPPTEEEVKTIVTRIREVVLLTIAKLQPSDKGPDFQFHPGSNLLIVMGTHEAIDATRKTIAAMERGL